MNTPVFPVEIFDLIINFCGVNLDIDSTEVTNVLRSCCLVSKDFVPLSRRHLFSKVEIGFDDNLSLTRSRLVGVLEKNPYVGRYVKSVRYIFNSEKERKIIGRGTEVITIHHLVVDNDKYPASLHDFFPNVHELWVENADRPISQNYMSPAYPEDNTFKIYHSVLHDFTVHQHRITSLTINRLRIQTEDVFVLSHLRYLCSQFCQWPVPNYDSLSLTMPNLGHPLPLQELQLMGTSYFPIKIIKYFPDLARVNIADIAIRLGSQALRPVSPIPIPTTSLLRSVVVNRIGILRDLLSHIPPSTPLSSLSSLHIRKFGRTDDVQYLEEILSRSPNIRRLEISSISTYYTEHAPLTLDTCIACCRSSLEHIRFQNDASNDNVRSNVIPLLCSTLSALRGDNSLKTIQLDIHLWPEDLEKWMEVTPAFWGRLDEVLAVASDFPRLEMVCISVDYTDLNAPSRKVDDWVYDSNEMVTEFWKGSLTLLQRSYEVTHTYDGPCCQLVFKRV